MLDKRIFYPTRQAISKTIDFSLLECLKAQADTINEEAQKWLSCSKSKYNNTICGFSAFDIVQPISIENFIAFKAYNMLRSDIVLFSSNAIYEVLEYLTKIKDKQDATDLDKINILATNRYDTLDTEYFSWYTDTYWNIADKLKIPSKTELIKMMQKELRIKAKKFELDWIKCQVLVNATDAPWRVNFSEIFIDYYTTKDGYIKACKHRGVLIVDFPESLVNNVQLVSIILDMIRTRSYFAPTILFSNKYSCITYCRQDGNQVELLSQIRNAEPNICDILMYTYPMYGPNTEIAINNMLENILIQNGWIENKQ